jgi:hypothetical protein
MRVNTLRISIHDAQGICCEFAFLFCGGAPRCPDSESVNASND